MFAMGPAFFKQAGASYATLTLTGTFAAATVGSPYSSSIPISGGLEPYALTGGTGVASGALDSGFSLAITGSAGARFLTLSCASPTTADTMTFTASVDSSDGQTATSAQSVVVSSGSTAYRDAVLTDAPLHYFRLGETSGTVVNNIGTSGLNGTWTSDASNWTGAGLITGDPDPCMLIPPGAFNYDIISLRAVTNTDLSVELVIQPLGPPSGSAGSGCIWSYGPPATNSPGLDYVDASGGRFRLRYMKVGAAVIITSANTYTYGTKLHVVIRYTRSTNLCEMWINGVKEAGTGTFVASTTAYNMIVGNQNFPPWGTFNGKIDDVAYYNKLLSPTRIAAHAALI